MITIYQLDAQGVFIGEREIDPMGPLPVPLAMTAPPKTTGEQVARWNGSKWEKLAERPALPPAPPTFSSANAAVLAMVDWINALLAQITGPVPADVKHGWPAKAAWARAWDADNSTPVPPTITAEMTAAGDTYRNGQGDLDASLIAAKIIANADVYEPVIAETDGLRSETQDLLRALEADTSNTDPFKFDKALASAQAKAIAMAAARGINLPAG